MTVAETSRWAYERVDLNTRQEEVADALRKLGGYATDARIAAHLRWSINRVTPRRGELVEQGLVVRARLIDGPFGAKVSLWRLVLAQGDLFEPEDRDRGTEGRA
jgi:hypothetical protein